MAHAMSMEPGTHRAGPRTQAGANPARQTVEGVPDGIAQRANAGPHASSLAALQAVVAQRACADCETVRRTMGGGPLVQRAAKYPGTARSALPGIRSATSAEASPVQRVRVGPDGQYDTHNPEHYEAVAAELGRMSYEQLETVRAQLDANNEMDRYHLAAIDYEINKAKILDAVSAHADKYPGFIPTAASVFVNGMPIFSTEPVSRADSSNVHYQAGEETPEDQQAEENVSRDDSEVATLDEAWTRLRDELAGWSVGEDGQPVQLPPMVVRIVLAGLSGPCTGCKQRIERFRRDILDLLPAGSSLDVESAYLNASRQKPRFNHLWKEEVPTTYGWEDAEAAETAHGARYYRHSYPQEIALAGAGDFVAVDEYGAALFDHGAVQDEPAWTSDGAMAGTFGSIDPEADQAGHEVPTVAVDADAAEHGEHVEPREEGVAGAKRSRSTAQEGGADEDEIEAKRRKPEDQP